MAYDMLWKTLVCTDCFYERELIASQGMFGAYQGKPGQIRLTTHGKDDSHHLCLIQYSTSLSTNILGYDDEFIGGRPPTRIAALQLFTFEWPFTHKDASAHGASPRYLVPSARLDKGTPISAGTSAADKP